MNIPQPPNDTSAAPRDSVLDTESVRELRVLEAVDGDPTVSQRALARDLGVAVGVVNSCMRTLVRKGMIKVRGENNRSITYHLTHDGVTRKASLAMQWTANTLEFYRTARRKVGESVVQASAEGHRTAVVYGANELAEIALLVAAPTPLTVVALVRGADRAVGDAVLGAPVLDSEDDCPEPLAVDLVVLAEIAPAERLAALATRFPSASVVSLLGQPLQ